MGKNHRGVRCSWKTGSKWKGDEKEEKLRQGCNNEEEEECKREEGQEEEAEQRARSRMETDESVSRSHLCC